jgi:glutamate-1-semialdehyde 2,1-aminomutase
LPVGAFGGRKDLMQQLAPLGPVYQAGTMSGNPLAVTAGLVLLDEISAPGFHSALEASGKQLLAGLTQLAHEAGLPFVTTQVGGMFGLYFNENERIETFAQVMESKVDLFRAFFHGMLDRGVYLAPSAFEAGFISAAHGEADIAATLDAARSVFATIKQ